MEMRHAIEVTSVLRGYRYLNLTTFRKNGTPVVTTVWFAQMEESVYLWTAKTRGKVKRIRNNPTVQIAPSTHLGRPCGPGIEGSARILAVGEQQVAEQLIGRKYGWQKRVFSLIWRLQRRSRSISRSRLCRRDVTQRTDSIYAGAFAHRPKSVRLRYYYTVNSTLAKCYFEQLTAPVKGFYTFEQSAHSPIFEEPEKVRNILQGDILAGGNSLADAKLLASASITHACRLA